MAIHDLRAVLNAGVKADWWRWCRRHRQPRLPRRSRPSSPESPPNPNPRSAASGADSPFQQKVFPHESCHDRKRANTAGCWCWCHMSPSRLTRRSTAAPAPRHWCRVFPMW
jgi:hypothetical protein